MNELLKKLIIAFGGAKESRAKGSIINMRV